MYFPPNPVFSQAPYFPKYTNDHKIGHFSKGHKNNNSTLTWPRRNATVHETSPDMGTDRKSVSTKNVNSAPKTTSSYDIVDKFGIMEIYPTNPDGRREWYLNMNNPINDSIFFIGSGQGITKESDGSWRITNPEVRMAVTTPQNSKP